MNKLIGKEGTEKKTLCAEKRRQQEKRMFELSIDFILTTILIATVSVGFAGAWISTSPDVLEVLSTFSSFELERWGMFWLLQTFVGLVALYIALTVLQLGIVVVKRILALQKDAKERVKGDKECGLDQCNAEEKSVATDSVAAVCRDDDSSPEFESSGV